MAIHYCRGSSTSPWQTLWHLQTLRGCSKDKQGIAIHGIGEGRRWDRRNSFENARKIAFEALRPLISAQLVFPRSQALLGNARLPSSAWRAGPRREAELRKCTYR